jgi:putative endonuclease
MESMQPKPHFFYLGRCSDGSLYAGTAVNLKERERRHNEGSGGRYTRTRLPVTIVYSETFASMSDARKREAGVKTWPKERKGSVVRRRASLCLTGRKDAGFSTSPGIALGYGTRLWYNTCMKSIIRDVTALDETHRRALEEVLGRELRANQRLVINVLEFEVPGDTSAAGERPAQSLDDWTRVFEGLSDDQIERIDEVAKTRAKLTRNLP